MVLLAGSFLWFQSTLPSVERSDQVLRHRETPAWVSIHAPLRREERRDTECPTGNGQSVSIHAPLRREERQSSAKRIWVVPWFQSTLPSVERSDMAYTAAVFETYEFQSTLPSVERSDDRGLVDGC